MIRIFMAWSLRYEALKVKYGQTSEDELMKTDKVPTIIGQENVSNCLPSLDTGLSNSLADDAVEEAAVAETKIRYSTIDTI